MLEVRIDPEGYRDALTVEVRLDNLPDDAALLESVRSPSPGNSPPTMATVNGFNTGTDLKQSLQLPSEPPASVSLEDSMHTHQPNLQNPPRSYSPVLPLIPPIPAQDTTISTAAPTTDRRISALTSGTTASTGTSRSVLRYQRAALQREYDQLKEQMARMESSMQASNKASAAQIGNLMTQIVWMSRQLAANQGHEGAGIFADTPFAEEAESPPEYDSSV
jgi:hypothetical protein